MGVVYKLRQDIVDFIVQTKRNDLSLSCRKLVGVIKTKYGVDVSKSSVNGVIKEYQLSGPIGRYPRFKAPRNFAIPKDKKTILLENVKPFLVPIVSSDPVSGIDSCVVSAVQAAGQDVEPVEQASVVADPAVAEIHGIEGVQAVEGERVDDRLLVLRPDLLQWSEPVLGDSDPVKVMADNISREEKRKESDAPLSVWRGDTGMLYGRAGASILWFVFKSACSKSHLGDTLARVLAPLPKGVTPEQCEVLFFAAFFGEHRPGFESDDLRTLWRLSGLEETQGRALSDRLSVLDANRALYLAVRTELDLAFTPARYFRLLTQKGARFYVDAQSMALHYDFIDAGQASSILPIFLAVERAVDRIITNINPFISDIVSAGISPELISFIHIMEGFGDDSLAGVEVIGNNDNKCAEFHSVPLMRREFIVRVRLTHQEMANIQYDLLENTTQYVNEILGSDWHYLEGAFQYQEGAAVLRVLTVKSAQGDEFVLLSNCTKADMPVEKVLEAYLSGCKFENMGGNIDNMQENCHSGTHSTNISGIFRDIDIKTQKFIFQRLGSMRPWAEMCQFVYDLPGYIKDHPKALLIRLQLPKDFSSQKWLADFLRKMNSASLRTADGRRVLFSNNEEN